MLVSAPAGFGKTTAVAAWCATRHETTVWFSASPGIGATGLIGGVAAAASAAGLPGFRGVLDAVGLGHVLGGDAGVVETGVDSLIARWRAVAEPVTVVVDDAHGVDLAASPGLVRLLTDLPAHVRVVLVGRDNLAAALAREVAYDEVRVLDGADLAMTLEETGELVYRSGASIEPGELHARTGGWPLAVRAALWTGAGGGTGTRWTELLPDVVRTEILDRVSPEIARLMLTTTVVRQLDADLAAALCGEPCEPLLEECVARGQFLARVEQAGRPPTYIWHEAFAEACQRLVARTDIGELRRRHRVVAEHIKTVRPMEALRHALDGGDAELAETLLAGYWPVIVTDGAAGQLSELAARARTMRDTPLVGLVWTIAVVLTGNRAAAARLPAPAPRERDGRDALAEAFRRALVGVDSAPRRAACDDIRAALAGDHGLSPTGHASALFLLGWTETRLRRDPRLPLNAMQAARQEASALGLRELERRVAADLAVALVIAGRLREALVAAEEPGEPEEAEAGGGTPSIFDTAASAFARGYAFFWMARHEEAWAWFTLALEREPRGSIVGAISRVMAAIAACAGGTTQMVDQAERWVHDIEGEDMLGLPVAGFAGCARALIEARRGNRKARDAHARVVEAVEYLPAMHVLVAQMRRRSGELAHAREIVERIPYASSPIHVQASILVTRAVHARAEGGFDAAHRFLEAALDVAAPHECLQPFDCRHEHGLRSLLEEHAGWGGRHEMLLVRLLGLGGEIGPPAHGLSEREREILSYLRTTMTVAEIAERLFVSVNTHQRTLYRKLGVTSRREAIRARI